MQDLWLCFTLCKLLCQIHCWLVHGRDVREMLIISHKVQGASSYFFAFSRDSPLKNICKNSFINVSEFSKQIVWNHLCSFQRLKGLFAALLNHSILKTLRRTKFRKVNQRCHDKAQELHITFWRLHSISFCFSDFSYFDDKMWKNKGLLCFLSLNSSWRTGLLVVWKRNE